MPGSSKDADIRHKKIDIKAEHLDNNVLALLELSGKDSTATCRLGMQSILRIPEQ